MRIYVFLLIILVVGAVIILFIRQYVFAKQEPERKVEYKEKQTPPEQNEHL